MSLQTAKIDESWRQRCIELAKEGLKARQAEWRAKADAYNAQQRELRLRQPEIEREREAAERRKLAAVLIREWDRRLRAYALAMQGPERGQAWADARRDLVAFGTMLQQRSKMADRLPNAADALREYGNATRWEKQPYLKQVLASEEPGRMIDRMLQAVEDGGLEHPAEPHVAAKEYAMPERAPGHVMVR